MRGGQRKGEERGERMGKESRGQEGKEESGGEERRGNRRRGERVQGPIPCHICGNHNVFTEFSSFGSVLLLDPKARTSAQHSLVMWSALVGEGKVASDTCFLRCQC